MSNSLKRFTVSAFQAFQGIKRVSFLLYKEYNYLIISKLYIKKDEFAPCIPPTETLKRETLKRKARVKY